MKSSRVIAAAVTAFLAVGGIFLLWRGSDPRAAVADSKRERTPDARDPSRPYSSPGDSPSEKEEGQREFVEDLVRNWQGFSREQMKPFLGKR